MSCLKINGHEIEARDISETEDRWFIDGQMCRADVTLKDIIQKLRGTKPVDQKQEVSTEVSE